jgi:uncharacterized damage-inducible protein DinB
MKEILINYTSYNLWANTKLVDVLKNIEPSLLSKEIKSSFPTINKTICHIWGAEEIWYKRLNEVEQPNSIGFNFSGETKDAIASFLKMSAIFNEFISKKDDPYFQSNNTYKDLKGNTHTNSHWQMIMHCMNHSTYHRGQLVTMLREVGETKIPSTDMIGYFRETK